jgi:hypothetical protein
MKKHCEDFDRYMRLTALAMIGVVVSLVGLSGLLLAPASFFVELAK